MAEDDWKVALAALAGIGLGAAAYAKLSGETRRRAFVNALREALEENHIGLVDAQFGRSHGEPVWLVTVNHPLIGINRYSVRLDTTSEPYAQSTLNEVIQRVLTAAPPIEAWG